jgi:hypothetical protein
LDSKSMNSPIKSEGMSAMEHRCALSPPAGLVQAPGE